MRLLTHSALLAVLAGAPARAQQPAAAPAAPTAAPGDSTPSVTLPPALDRVLRDYERAWTARDAAGLSALFAEDGFVLQLGRPPVRGREAIRAAYAGAGGPLRLRAFAYATSGDVGYILGGYAGGTGAADDGKFTLTLKRARDGRWLIMSDMDNPNRRAR